MVSLNARVGAVALIGGSAMTLALGFAPELVPLRFIALGICVFGAWSFVDEMGIRKPLNRSGMVAFSFAAVAKTLMLLNGGANSIAGGSLLYAFSLLLALLLWSIAFLHRDRGLKIAGAVGASVTALPILALIAGHIFVGVGAFWGIGTLYTQAGQVPTTTPQIITIIEVVLVMWSLLAGAALWTGRIEASSNR